MWDQRDVLKTPDRKTWRYTSLRHFEDLIRTRELHFTRIDHFRDQLEGAKSDVTFYKAMRRSMATYMSQPSHLFDTSVESAFVGALGVEAADHRFVREGLFACCWHMNEDETPAMWQEYGADGVAIQSTIGRLFLATRKPVDGKNVYLIPITYIDRKLTDTEEEVAFLYKDRAYEYEKEVRLFVLNPAQREKMQLPDGFPTYLRVPCDRKILVEAVHLPPQSRDFDRVRFLLDEFGLAHVLIVTRSP